MWEGRKMARRVVILEEKIEKVQINVAETKAKYDKAVDELEKLLMKRKERDNKQLLPILWGMAYQMIWDI